MLEGELRAPEPGEPGDPGEPGLSEAEGGGLDRLVLVEPEKASLKLGFCLPEKLDFARISLSSGSFTANRSETLGFHRSHRTPVFFKHPADCTHPDILTVWLEFIAFFGYETQVVLDNVNKLT